MSELPVEMLEDTLTVPARFCGPATSGNGGWSAGALAEVLHRVEPASAHEAIEVTLRQPPPLDTALSLSWAPHRVSAWHHDQVVAQACTSADFDPTPLRFVDPEVALAAQETYAGHAAHPFPSCFACGPAREADDGLRIFPGHVPGSDLVAATWTPHHSAATTDHADVPVVWAALDCIGGWAHDIGGRPMVLGRMTSHLLGQPRIGSLLVAVGRLVNAEGRKAHTRSTLFTADGEVIGVAAHTWIAIDPAAFNNLTTTPSMTRETQ